MAQYKGEVNIETEVFYENYFILKKMTAIIT